MKLLLCCATTHELNIVKQEIKTLNLKSSLPIVYLCTGIGNHETIFQLTKFLATHAEETFFILNIGVCGWTSSPFSKASSHQRTIPPVIQASIVEHIAIKKEIIIPIFLHIAPLGKLISSEIPVDTPLEIEDSPTPLFVDMESKGIELVAQHFKFPHLLLKVPVDEVGAETRHFDHKKALELLRKNIDYKKLIEKTLEYINNLS